MSKLINRLNKTRVFISNRGLHNLKLDYMNGKLANKLIEDKLAFDNARSTNDMNKALSSLSKLNKDKVSVYNNKSKLQGNSMEDNIMDFSLSDITTSVRATGTGVILPLLAQSKDKSDKLYIMKYNKKGKLVHARNFLGGKRYTRLSKAQSIGNKLAESADNITNTSEALSELRSAIRGR